MNRFNKTLGTALSVLLFLSITAQAWWDEAWTARQKITIDPSAAQITEPVADKPTVLVRLHEGNFPFLSAAEDGHDIRFVTEDDQTVLPSQIEKYDALLNEGFVWVQLPEMKPGEKTALWIYSGNAAAPAPEAKMPFDGDTILVYHFGENGAPPADATGHGHAAEGTGIAVEGSLIGTGMLLDGRGAITIPAAPELQWTAGAPFSWSLWIKPIEATGTGLLFSRGEGAEAFRIGLAAGVPYVEIGTERSPAGDLLAAESWHHVAVVAESSKTSLLVDGKLYGIVGAGVPASNAPLLLGDANGLSVEVDELNLSGVSRSVGTIQLAAVGEGTGGTSLLNLGEIEGAAGEGGHSAAFEHVMLFGDIAKNMMFDGWIAVGVCAVMVVLGWFVAIRKFSYLNSIQKGSDLFMKRWKDVSTDLTVLDQDDPKNRTAFGADVDPALMNHLRRSPLYHLYEIGSDEIQHRIGRNRRGGLSARAMQAIRASLETGMVRENHRMNKGLILLTISIAGGPYVGLLGTVVGVMITFAIIAKSGEVDVNSIAPGIASALLATVAGLVVAIPALFIYSYLSSRIKDLLATMQVFVDEFISKMAEFYPEPTSVSLARPSDYDRDPNVINRQPEVSRAD